ncbi:MAG: hypothetical protein ACPG7F_18280 [Aggregatilineales bacterium]
MPESKKPLHIYYHNQHILVFDFHDLSTKAARHWGAICLKYNGQYPDPLRVLYDFRGCGFPSLYIIAYERLIAPQIIFPTDVQHAYLIEHQLQDEWAKEFIISLPEHVKTRMFDEYSKNDAIAWLMEKLADDTTQNSDIRVAQEK